MNPFKQAAKQAAQKEGSDLPGKVSSAKLAIGEATLNRLPVLTEIAMQGNQLYALNAEEMGQFLQQFQTHIETLFTNLACAWKNCNVTPLIRPLMNSKPNCRNYCAMR
jgi:hypothetical protein